MPAAKDRATQVPAGVFRDLLGLVPSSLTSVRRSLRLPEGLGENQAVVLIFSGKKGECLKWEHAPAPSKILENVDFDLLNSLLHNVIVAFQPLAAPAIPALTEEEKKTLRKGGLDPDKAGGTDPIKAAAARYAWILASGLTVEQAAARLGYSDASRVRQRLTAKPPTLYGIKLGAEWRLPLFQFDKEGLVPGLERVIAALDPTQSPVEVERWLTTPHVDLVDEEERDRRLSPLDWLRTGRDTDVVVALASNL